MIFNSVNFFVLPFKFLSGITFLDNGLDLFLLGPLIAEILLFAERFLVVKAKNTGIADENCIFNKNDNNLESGGA